jgi:corrinoid protein of di/trimethylamine methyltransferase
VSLQKSKETLLKQLSDCVVEMEDEKIIPIAEAYVKNQYPAMEGIMNGLADGMNRAGKLCDEDIYFIPELLGCADAMYNGIGILKPHLPKATTAQKKPKVVIGVVEGDTHDIGKNLVKLMLEAANFEIYDLGRDVVLDNFVTKAREVNAELICLSTLMSTTMEGMRTIIQKLEQEGIRANHKVMIGGSCISQSFADKIGADGYSANATEAVRLAKRLVSA